MEYYATLIDALKYYVSIKTKQERSREDEAGTKLNQDEINIVMNKFVVVLTCLTSILDSPSSYLKKTVD